MGADTKSSMKTTAALETQSNPLDTTAGAAQPEAAAPVDTQGAPLPEEEPQNSEPAPAEAEEEEEEEEFPEFPGEGKQYPLPPHPDNRMNDFENVLQYIHQSQQSIKNGETPKPPGFGRYNGTDYFGEPRKYQSKFDERFDHFTHWVHGKWTSGVSKLPNIVQRGYDKTYNGMYWVGEKVSGAAGVDSPRYQWVIDAHEQEKAQAERDEREDQEAMWEAEQVEAERIKAQEEAAVEAQSMRDLQMEAAAPEQ